MIRMKMPDALHTDEKNPADVLQLTEQVILAAAVCVTEGIASSVAFMLPKGIGLYYGCFIMLFGIWLAMSRFRQCKLGADIGDLYFLELVTWGLAGIFFIAGKRTDFFWYCFNLLFFLRLIRVCAWQGTVIYDHGWGVFGILGHIYSKKNKPAAISRAKQALGLIFAISLAIGATIILKEQDDQHRAAVPWAFAFIYLVGNGPILLRAIANVITAFFATQKSESDLTAAVNQLETKLANHNNAQVDPDGVGAELIANYYALAPDKRAHYMATSRKLVQLWPAEPPAKK